MRMFTQVQIHLILTSVLLPDNTGNIRQGFFIQVKGLALTDRGMYRPRYFLQWFALHHYTPFCQYPTFPTGRAAFF